jgi:hypothetical protein
LELKKERSLVSDHHLNLTPWAEAGVRNHLKILDTGLRRNDGKQ